MPGAEGGITEYLGHPQRSTQLRGFLTHSDLDVAGAIWSGALWMPMNADQMKDHLLNIQVSGPQLLKIESTLSPISGQQIFYANEFYHIQNVTFGYEAGHLYPYYPYTLDLHRARTRNYGNSSGVGALGSPIRGSGYVQNFELRSGRPQGEFVVGMALYAAAADSGVTGRVGVYSALNLVAQSHSSPINSGWNYFPVRPTFRTVSGTIYQLAFKTDATTLGQFNIGGIDIPTELTTGFQSGVFSSGFPLTYAPGTFDVVSGYQYAVYMVTL